MEREFERYNKNIDEFDARNVFEYDILQELNRKKFNNSESKQKITLKKIKLLKDNNKQHPSFN